MTTLRLNEQELASIHALLAEITATYRSPEDPRFLEESSVWAHELPRRLRKALVDFKLREPIDARLVISGYLVDGRKIGATPKHWAERASPPSTFEEEVLLLLIGCVLGDPIGWFTQQDGRIVHDIFPIQGHEGEQLGTGSKELLWWHTEDAFHPFRGDYLGMMCLRNPDGVPTTFWCLKNLPLSDRQRDLLFQPLFTIRPDESHLRKNMSASRQVDEVLDRAYGRIERMRAQPERIPIFFGDTASPYIRLDPYFMDPAASEEAQEALNELIRVVDEGLEDLVLTPGDICLIDNWKAVHGRKPFRARYDGNDRWLKRINVVRDLRKSRDARVSAESRVIC